MSNTSCPNCNARLSCGCQKRQASNGTAACTNCLASIEANIKVVKEATPTTVILPQWGANRYNKTN